MEATIKDFMDLCLEDSYQLVEVWDSEEEDTVYKGVYSDMPSMYEDYIIMSWNTTTDNGICFNI